MQLEKNEVAIRRLIKTDKGIDPALRLLEQMLGTAAIGERKAENLKRVLERRKIGLMAKVVRETIGSVLSQPEQSFQGD